MKSIFIFFIIVIFSSCNPVKFCTWDSGYEQVLQEPLKKEVIGKYILTEKSKEYLKHNYESWPLQMELFEDNSLDFISNQKPSSEKKWFVTKFDSGYVIELTGICVTSFSTKNNQFAIPISIGDPDQCEGIVYEKIE